MTAAASPATALLSCAAESELIASVIAVSTSLSARVTVGANVGLHVSLGPRRAVKFRRKRGSIHVGAIDGDIVGAYVEMLDVLLLESRPELRRFEIVLPTVPSVPGESPTPADETRTN